MTTYREKILTDAITVVSKDRSTDYGTPERNFEKIAAMWSGYLSIPIKPHDVAALLIMVKLARITTSPAKEDHWIDIAGYAACGGEIVAVNENRTRGR